MTVFINIAISYSNLFQFCYTTILVKLGVFGSWGPSGKPATKARRLKETQRYILDDVNLLRYNIPLFRFLSAKPELLSFETIKTACYDTHYPPRAI